MDESSTKKKKKRGRSLILTTCFGPSKSPANGGKILASDDNLVYCDVTKNCVEPEVVKKSSSSRSRMSRIFKAVLFDTAVKKKIRGKKSSEASTDSVTSSLAPTDEKNDHISNENNSNIVKILEDNNSLTDKTESTDNILFDSDSNVMKVLEENNSPNDETEKINNIVMETNSNIVKKLEENDSFKDSSNVSSLSLKHVDTQVASTCVSSDNASSQMLTKRKVTSRVNSMDKKPPLPSNSRPSPKTVPKKDSKSATLKSNTTIRLCLFILVGVFILVGLWMSYKAILSESLDADMVQDTNVVVVGDEL